MKSGRVDPAIAAAVVLYASVLAGCGTAGPSAPTPEVRPDPPDATVQDFSFEYEEDLGQGQTQRRRIEVRWRSTGGSRAIIEQSVRAETRQSSGRRGRRAPTDRSRIRFEAYEGDLEPRAYRASAEWWDGSERNSERCEIEFAAYRVEGTCTESGRTFRIDRVLPEGTLIAGSLLLRIQSLLSAPRRPASTELSVYDPWTDRLRRLTASFGRTSTVTEMGRDFDVIEVAFIGAVVSQTVLYSLEYPHFPIRHREGSRTGRITKLD